ncbi:hypothetical protein LWE61_08240 [Sphingobium sufflavum]|uniref:hypothetical protein n=1 Tax=Sphingobium sufflavum TaxID=1129547 RepID=UPI001F22B215|nr:hypothetical protein [Sphingobium sufflavum]MCE7796551.1 hypothetical protein [Sphingobium sufflavum]
MADDKEVGLLYSMIVRADKLATELQEIYQRDLEEKNISPEALNLTHEVIEKCSNTLDQSMSVLFQREIRPHLQNPPVKGGYFPAGKDENAYRSTLGQWGAADLRSINPSVDAKLRSLQPFTDDKNGIYARIKGFAAHKHTGLRPQLRSEQRRVNVTRPGVGGVSWGPGVTFSGAVSVMGVPINPYTQMPAHNRDIDVTVENWVRFLIEDTGEDALAFCKSAISATRTAIAKLF